MVKNNENSQIKHIRILESYNDKNFQMEIIGAIIYYNNQEPDIFLSDKKEDRVNVIINVRKKVMEYRKQNPMLTYPNISKKGEITQHIIDDPEIHKVIEAELNNALDLYKKGNIAYHQLANIEHGKKFSPEQLKNMLGPDFTQIAISATAAIAGIMMVASAFKACSSETRSSTDIVVENTLESENEQTIVESDEEQARILPERPAGEDDYDNLFKMAADYFEDPSKYPDGIDGAWVRETFGVGDPLASERFFKGVNRGLCDGKSEMEYTFYEKIQTGMILDAGSSIINANKNNISSVYESIKNNAINKNLEFYISEKTRQGKSFDKDALVASLSEEFDIIAYYNMYGETKYITDTKQIINDLFPAIEEDKMLKDCVNMIANIAETTGNYVPTVASQYGVDAENPLIVKAGEFLKKYDGKYIERDMYKVIDNTVKTDTKNSGK